MLRIHLFGNLRLFLDKEPIRFSGLPKTLPLWTYLLLHRHAPLGRERLAFTLWPDDNETSARSNLRRHLHDLRRSLPPTPDEQPWLLTEGSTVQWNSKADYWLDVEAFEMGIQDSAQLAEATGLYSGDLLPDLYEDWIFFDRERLRNDFFQALGQLLQQRFASRNYRQGIDLVVRLLTHDPLREDAVRDLMLLRYLSGDRTGALREYKQFEQRLSVELQVAPMPETNELYRAIVQNETLNHLLPEGQHVPVVVIDSPSSTAQAASLAALAMPPGTPEAIPIRPVRPHNVPAALASFVGRTQELDRLVELVHPDSYVRLLTLTGTVGAGKTRLALALAYRLLDSAMDFYMDGIFFVPLSTVSEPAGVIPALAAVLGVSESGHRPLIEDIKAYLTTRHLLLILDNFEQVNAAASQIGELLTALPHLRVVVTSRSVLHVYGEYEFPVLPLELPRSINLPVAQMATYPAITLFCERAQAVNPQFQLNAENAGAVAQICLELDGLPLALELAAARCKLFTPAALLTRLSSSLDFLQSGFPQTPSGLRTLRSVIEWSYNLLSPDEQILFSQLGVFAGPFSLEAVESVIDVNLLTALSDRLSSDTFDILAGLTSLIDQNMLLSAEPNVYSGDPRFRILLILREFALGQLRARRKLGHLQRRHASYYLSLVEQAAPQFHGPQQVLWLEFIDAEIENLRAVLHWSMAQTQPETALRLVIALGGFWTARGNLSEGQEWVNRILALPQVEAYPLLRAEALVIASRIAYYRGDYLTQKRRSEESIQICQLLGDETIQAQALYTLGSALLYQHDYPQAQQVLEDALARSRMLNDRLGIAMAMQALSMLFGYLQDRTTAWRYIEESMEIFRTLGDTGGIASTLLYMASLAYDEGDYTNAKTLFERCLLLLQPLGTNHALAFTWVSLASLELHEDNVARAKQLAEQALALFLEHGEHWQPPRLKRLLAYIAIEEDDVSHADALCQESFVLNQALDDQRGMIACVVAFAHIAIARGDLRQAARLIHAAHHHLAISGLALLVNDLDAYEQAVHHIRANLAPSEWSAIKAETAVPSLQTIFAEFSGTGERGRLFGP